MKNKLKNITFGAIFTAIICIFAQIAFITPSVPLTLQTLGVALCGYTLSPKWSFACIFTYLAMGACGLPVFSNFRGGMQILLGPTGGFLFGFIILTAACAFAAKLNKIFLIVIFSSAGIVLCHLIGALQYSAITGNGLYESVLTACLPFVFKDILCVVAAYATSKILKRGVKRLDF